MAFQVRMNVGLLVVLSKLQEYIIKRTSHHLISMGTDAIETPAKFLYEGYKLPNFILPKGRFFGL